MCMLHRTSCTYVHCTPTWASPGSRPTFCLLASMAELACCPRVLLLMPSAVWPPVAQAATARQSASSHDAETGTGTGSKQILVLTCYNTMYTNISSVTSVMSHDLLHYHGCGHTPLQGSRSCVG